MLGFVLVLALVNAGGNLRQSVGESCDKTPTFVIGNFDVSPWPLFGTQQYTITIPGQFISKEYVKEIYIGTRLNRGFWHYTYQTIKADYAKGTNTTFTISLQAPSEKGSYTDQVTFHRSDFSYVACWQFDYDITR